MPAGDLLTGPDQIEWGGLLIDTHRSDSGLWLHEESRLEGWHATYSADDLPTASGASPGIQVPDPMYPMALGVCVEYDTVPTLFAAMAPNSAEATLAWIPRSFGLPVGVGALARRCEPSTAYGTQFIDWAVIDLMWMVPRPVEILPLP